MLNTKELAKKLNIIETVHVNKVNKHSIQTYQYLLVLDFESTCFDRANTVKFIPPEIIEFPVVLFQISTNKILEEFQQYVMPSEYYKLSDFCVNFTGITQDQVDNGVPLGTCLMLFSRWITEMEKKHGIVLYRTNQTNANCIFVTWSDWDLGNCLLNECKRKQIRKPDYFKCWADLRALYREYYNRKPQGLKGALNEVGLEFQGREHSGLHDARNTAYLAGKMIQDGLLVKITKELDIF